MAYSGMKKCTRCTKQKPISDFRKSTRGALSSWCRECEREYQRELYARNPEMSKIRSANWRVKYASKFAEKRKQERGKYYASEIARKYNLTRADAVKLLEHEGKKCKACGVVFDATKPLLRRNLDHCHATGKVRGFLCSRCNTVAGFVNDDARILQQIATYLKRCITT